MLTNRLYLARTAAVLAATGFTGVASADILTQFNFNGGLLTPSTTAANTSTTTITGGAGVFVGPSNSFYASAPFMIVNRSFDDDASQYWQFTVTAADGYELDLTSFTFDGARGGASAPRTYSVRTSVGGTGFGAPSIGSGEFTFQRSGDASATDTMPTFTFDLSGPEFQNLTSITFRVFFDTPGVSQNIDIDNVTVNGMVSPIPEPSTAALGLGAALLMLRKRSR